MSSNQIEIKFMLAKLYEWNTTLGGSEAKRSMASSEFDFLQEEFLSKRHMVEKLQDRLDSEILNAKNANLPGDIRDGIKQLQQILVNIQDEHKRLTNKKKDTPAVLEKKEKIVENCQILMRDIEERQESREGPRKPKVTTLTDMKAKLLRQIDENANAIHHDASSDGELSGANEEEEEAKRKYREKDEQMDVVLDEIIGGLQVVRNKVKGINEKQDEIIDKTKKADQKITKVSKRIEQDNDKLKKIIEQFKPSRCCLWIALLLLFIGLIVCIIKFVV